MLTPKLNKVMYLNRNAAGAGTGRLFTQISQVMRLTAVLLLVGCLQVSANGIAQTITISEKNAPLDKIFKQIEKQTSYVFFYDDHILQNAKKVDVNLKNASIEHVLTICLKDTQLNYRIVGNTIIVVMKSKVYSVTETVQNTDKITTYIDVKGKVTNENGDPIAGVTVTVKGSRLATSTNSQGEFFIANTDVNAVLVFTGANVETFEIKVERKAELKISLITKINKLDEVQVIAYGTITRRLNVGNVATVKSEDIQKQPVSNILSALEGRVPGLFITQSNGLPNSGVTVRIQGQNSIQSGNDPLYVIDGIPYVSQLMPTIGSVLGGSGGSTSSPSGSGNPLNYINPADIESIEVLKDADATAIYGSRAANGAILITTKKGKAGQIKIDFNVQNGWGKVTRMLNVLNIQEYLKMRREALRNDNIVVSPADANYDINGTWDTTKNTNWQKKLIGKTAEYLDLQSTISGGSTNTQYLVAAAFHRETSVFPSNLADKKGSLHFSLNNSSANQKFKFQLSGYYLIDQNQLPNTDLTGFAVQLAPNAPSLLNEDGSLNWAQNASGISTWNNPLRLLYQKYSITTNNLFSSASLSYNVLPGLDIRSSFGYTNLAMKEISINPLISVRPESRANTSRSATYGNSNINSWIIEPQINYKRNFSKSRIDFLVGMTIQENNNNRMALIGSGYNSDLVLNDIKSATSIIISPSNGSIISKYRYNAIFGRLIYNYQDKYIFSFNSRRDGSSRFGGKNQFHNFGSVGAAWIFSQEKFFKDNFSFFSFAKIRSSYGTIGNDQIGDYKFLNLYNSASVAVPYQNTLGLTVNGHSNPYLQWEETRKLSIGIDLGLAKDRFIINCTYSINRSSNQLLNYALPIITGFMNVTENFPATVQNKSLEFSVNSTIFHSKKFEWTSSLNLTIPNNKLVEFPNLSTSTYASLLIIGQPVSIIKAYHFLGVDPATGQYVFSNKQGVPTSNPSVSTDRTSLINTLPTYYGGIQNSFTYNNFQLDFFVQFVKQKGANAVFGINNIPPGQFSGLNNQGNQSNSTLNRWKNPGDIASIQKYNSNSSLFTQLVNAQISDEGYSDASFVRLKNISLSWKLPNGWISRTCIKNAKLYMQSQNLFTLTAYQGMDPENRSLTSLPPIRMCTVGLQISLQ